MSGFKSFPQFFLNERLAWGKAWADLRSIHRMGWILLLAVFGLHALTILHYPDVYGDEPDEVAVAETWLKTGRVGFGIGEGVYSPRFQFLTNAVGNTARPAYCLAVAGAMRVGGIGLRPARFVSLLAAIFFAALVYTMAHHLWGTGPGVVALGFVLLNPLFGIAARTARPDMLVALAGPLAAALWMAGRVYSGSVFSFLAGLTIGFAPALHSNGIVYYPVMAAFLVLTHGFGKDWGKHLGICISGAVLGAVFWILSAQWDDFLMGWIVWKGYWGYKLPLLSGQSVVSLLKSEVLASFFPTAPLGTEMTGSLVWGLRFGYGLALVGLYRAMRAASRSRSAACLVVLTLVLFATKAFLLAQKNPAYLLLLLPPGALLVAFAFHEFWVQGWRKVVYGLGLVGVVVVGGASVHFQWRQIKSPQPYWRVCETLSSVIPPTARVLGPGQFWLGMRPRDWRDSNLAVFEKWLTNSAAHMPGVLERVSPDFVVADKALITLLDSSGVLGQWVPLGVVEGQTKGGDLLVLRKSALGPSLPDDEIK